MEEKEPENGDIEVHSSELEKVNENIQQVRELIEMGTQAFKEYVSMKTVESENQFKAHKYTVDTQFKMYWIDRALFALIIVFMGAMALAGLMPQEYFWTILIFSGGYFLRNEFKRDTREK